MNQNLAITLGAAAALLAGACSVDNSDYERKLRDALSEADVSLTQAIEVAESETSVGSARTAKLQVTSDRQFRVNAFGKSGASHQFAIALTGNITGDNPIDLSGGSCGSKTLGEIVAIAEAEVSGQGTSIELDDDEGCQYEVQVLTDADLMEVEVTGDGSVTDTETSDDDGTGEDD